MRRLDGTGKLRIALMLGLGLGGVLALATLVPLARSPRAEEPSARPAIAAAESAAEVAAETSIAPAENVPQSWHRHAAANGSYAVEFPAAPETRDTASAVATYEDGTKFYLARGDRSDPRAEAATPEEAQAYLDEVLPGVARLFGGEVIDYVEPLTADGYPGRRLAFTNRYEIQFEARVFFDPQQPRLFVAAFGTTEDNLAVPEAQRFFDSFEILPGDGNADGTAGDRP